MGWIKFKNDEKMKKNERKKINDKMKENEENNDEFKDKKIMEFNSPAYNRRRS